MTYEYACAACGHQWEAEQSIKDPPLKLCVACGAEKAKRLVSGGTGFLLKGGGWYADGYGSSKPASAGSSDSTPAAKSSDSSKPKSESAPASPGSSSTDSKSATPADGGSAGKSTSSTSASAAAS